MPDANNDIETQLGETTSLLGDATHDSGLKTAVRSCCDGDEGASVAFPSSSKDDDDASRSRSTRSGSRRSAKSRRRKKKKGDNASSTCGGLSDRKIKRRKQGPPKTFCHILRDGLRYLAIAASSMMLMVQIVPLVFFWGKTTWLQVAVKSYLVIFCASFVVTESHVPLLRRFTFHTNWIIRGFLYTFIGLVGMEQDLAIQVGQVAMGTRNVLGPTYGILFATLLMSITTWFITGVGLVYTLLGLLFFQGWYERLEKEHREKVEEWTQREKREKCSRDRQENRGEWYDELG